MTARSQNKREKRGRHPSKCHQDWSHLGCHLTYWGPSPDGVYDNFLKMYFIEVELLYHVGLISAAQQSESVIHI